MLNCKLISISNDLIYNSKDFLGTSSLSSFLLNLYMKEFDEFVLSLIFKYNLRKEIYKFRNNFSLSLFSYLRVLKRFCPIKIEGNLSMSDNLKRLVFTKYECVF